MKIKRNGKIQIIESIITTLSPRVPKAKRQTLKSIINQSKQSERHTRIINAITRS